MINAKISSFNYYLIPKSDRELATDWSSRIYSQIKDKKDPFHMDVKVFLSCVFLRNMDKIIKDMK